MAATVHVKTVEEIEDGRVRVEVNGERMYTFTEVAHLQVSEAELVSAPLRRRVEELEAELTKRTQERDEWKVACAGQERRVTELMADRDKETSARRAAETARQELALAKVQLKRELAEARQGIVDQINSEGPGSPTWGRKDRLYTWDQLVDAQVSEAELVSAPLRRRVEELEAKLARLIHRKGRIEELEDERETFKNRAYREIDRAAALNLRVSQLARELAEARQSVDARDRLLARAKEEAVNGRKEIAELCSQIADANEHRVKNRERAERAERNAAQLGVDLAEALKIIDRRESQLRSISDAETWGPRLMAEALQKVRDELESPTTVTEVPAD
jgi:chromosome segregation ATPase